MKYWRVLLSHARDTEGVAQAVDRAIQTVNRTLEAAGEQLRLELHGWKRDVLPGAAPRSVQEDLIDPELRFDEAEIVIGVFWTTLGTPVAGARSGSVHELDIAYESWKTKRRGHPHLLVYFNNERTFPRTAKEAEDMAAVFNYKEELKARPVFVMDYTGERQFQDLVTQHLLVKSMKVVKEPKKFLSPFSCLLSCSPLDVRAEGLSERVGDIVIQFQPTQTIPDTSILVKVWEFDIEVSLTPPLTRPNGGPPPRLIVGTQADAEVLEGRYGEGVNRNWVRFEKVQFSPLTGTQMIVTDLRTAAYHLACAATFWPATIRASLTVSEGANEVPVAGNHAVAAYLRRGFQVSVGASNPLFLPLPRPTRERESEHFTTATLCFHEGFSGAFKSAQQEAGPLRGAGWPPITLARYSDWGTRFGVIVSDLPPGVSVYVAVTDQPPDGPKRPRVQLVSDPDFAGAGRTPFAQPPLKSEKRTLAGIRLVKVDTRRRPIVWEWLDDGPTDDGLLREVHLGMLIVAPNPNAIAQSNITVRANLAPFYYTIDIRQEAPVPCFVGVFGPMSITGAQHHSSKS